MVKLKSIYTSLIILASSVAFGQSPIMSASHTQIYENQTHNNQEERNLSPRELVDSRINSMMSDPVLRNASWGLVIYDPKSKKIINSYNENASLIPASTTKLLTTDTAMALLSPKFRWTTQVEYSGDIDENGVLNGNLYIIGSGDPSIGTGKAGASTYSIIANDFKYAIMDKGIKKINGDIIIQTAVFKDNRREFLPENIVWLDLGKYYLPAGSTSEVDPKNEKITVRGKSPFDTGKRYFYVSPFTKKMAYTDEFSGGQTTTKVADAPAYLANSLRNLLIKSGVGVVGKVTPKYTDPNPEKRIYITAYKSPTLKEIIYVVNQKSDNSLSEALLRMSGFQKYGDQTIESGREAVRTHLRSVNFDMNGLNVFDGSGLSRSNAVTPIAQAKFLTQLMKVPYFNDYFESLPIGGQTGTLKRSFLYTGNGQVFAKTGTLNGVKTLAGYLKTNSGKTLVFSLMINRYSGSVAQVKSKMESILQPAFDL